MAVFSARNISASIVPVDAERIWAQISNPATLTALTPLVRSIVVENDLWRWQLAGIEALGVCVAPTFTERMELIEPRLIRFHHELPRPSVRHVGRAALLDVDGTCWLGLGSDAGPLVLPGEWKAARSTVGVPRGVLAAVHAHLPGRACITIDRSDARRPSDKTGIIVRGDASPPRMRSSSASIVVEIDKITGWRGFRSGVAA